MASADGISILLLHCTPPSVVYTIDVYSHIFSDRAAISMRKGRATWHDTNKSRNPSSTLATVAVRVVGAVHALHAVRAVHVIRFASDAHTLLLALLLLLV